VFQNDESRQRYLLDFEIRKVKEIHELIISSQLKPANIRAFKQRLLYLTRAFFKEGRGVWPFIYGRDYRPDMPDEEIEYLN